MEYFGVKLINRGKEFKLTREGFAIISRKPSLPFFPELAKINAYADENGSLYSEEWCKEYHELCMKNFDLNMKYFSMLDKNDFNNSLDTFLKRYKNFKEVTDLSTYAGSEGYYLMVLDEYKQVYIGKTEDIKKRIMQHWSKTKAFDRTLCPMYAYEKSCFSIDSFRAFDTTRIYVWEKKMSDGIEAELIKNFPAQFYTNRIGGDITNALQAMATMNKRDL